MNQLTTGDLHFVLSRTPQDVREILKARECIMGGGFIRDTIANSECSDIDLFVSNTDTAAEVNNALVATREGCKPHHSKNAITIIAPPRLPIQIITRWVFPDGESVVRSFDFTTCAVAVWWSKEAEAWRSACHPAFYSDLAARRLVYTSPPREEDAGGSMLRAIKFVARGYTIQPDSLAGVIARVARAVRWDEAHNEHLAASAICGLLREVDPLRVIDGLEIAPEEHGAVAK